MTLRKLLLITLVITVLVSGLGLLGMRSSLGQSIVSGWWSVDYQLVGYDYNVIACGGCSGGGGGPL